MVRQNIRNSPRSLYDLARTAQKLDDQGNLLGYSVEPGRNAELFEEVGLQSGDLIVEVNGLALSEPANGAGALKSLTSGEAVTVKLLRGGQEHTLRLEAQQ
jgi:general secretion pathway protein C